jgi:type IV pilus assembly protein PilY1
LGRITAKVNSPSTDNTATVAYAGDLLGNLWRFDLTQDPPVVTQMASLKDASGNAQPITTRPEVGVVNNNVVVYVATGKLLGASDLGSGGATNSIYGLVDTGKNLGNPRADSTVVRQTLSGTVTLTVSANAVAMPVNHGWYIDFITAGERVNVDPQLALGTLLVTSNIPTASPCSAGGSSYEYQLNYASGGAINGISAVATENTSAMTVGNIIEQLPSGAVKVISTLASGSQVTSGLNTGGTANTLRHVNWRVVPR